MTALKTLAGLVLIALLGFVLRSDPSTVNVGHGVWVNGRIPQEIQAPWFESVGCCLDEIVAAHREATRVHLSFSDPKRLGLEIPVPEKYSITTLDYALAPFFMGAHQLWAVDHGQPLLSPPNIAPQAEDLAAIQGAAVTAFQYEEPHHGENPVRYRLVFSSRRPAHAISDITPVSSTKTGSVVESTEYLVRSPALNPLALAEYRTDTGKLRPLMAGLELYAPTGLAFSPRNDFLYVVDERPSEIVWHELHVEDVCTNKWTYRGVIAHFPLAPSQRGLFRGIWIHPNGMILGAAPGGLYFYNPDGTKFGRIETRENVTYLLPTRVGNEDFVYAAVGQRLCRLRITSTATVAPLLPICHVPPVPAPFRKKKRKPPCSCPSAEQSTFASIK